MFDSLAERVNKDGCGYIITFESATFYLNGEPNYADDEVLDGEITLEHIGDYAISIEDYRRVAEDAHKNCTKLYMLIQSLYVIHSKMCRAVHKRFFRLQAPPALRWCFQSRRSMESCLWRFQHYLKRM